MIDQHFYTTDELADRWRVQEPLVRQMLRNGKLAGMKVGKSWRVPTQAVADYEEDHMSPVRKAVPQGKPRESKPMPVIRQIT